MTTTVRTGQAPARISRVEFRRRFRERFVDPAFEAERPAIDRLEGIAWDSFEKGRKAPLTRAVASAIGRLRAGTLGSPDTALRPPRPK